MARSLGFGQGIIHAATALTRWLETRPVSPPEERGFLMPKTCTCCLAAQHQITIGLPDQWHELCRRCAQNLDGRRPVVLHVESPSWDLYPP
jgi:hypothetical protein